MTAVTRAQNIFLLYESRIWRLLICMAQCRPENMTPYVQGLLKALPDAQKGKELRRNWAGRLEKILHIFTLQASLRLCISGQKNQEYEHEKPTSE
jgi:hypothetical protein